MRRYLVSIIVSMGILVAALIGFGVIPPGVVVKVRNTGQEVMRDLTVHVTGREYSLGDLLPGDFRTRKVLPTSESHVEVEFTDELCQRVRLNAGGYFEPGYRGEIYIEIRDGMLVAVKHQVRISIY